MWEINSKLVFFFFLIGSVNDFYTFSLSLCMSTSVHFLPKNKETSPHQSTNGIEVINYINKITYHVLFLFYYWLRNSCISKTEFMFFTSLVVIFSFSNLKFCLILCWQPTNTGSCFEVCWLTFLGFYLRYLGCWVAWKCLQFHVFIAVLMYCCHSFNSGIWLWFNRWYNKSYMCKLILSLLMFYGMHIWLNTVKHLIESFILISHS